ncbi:MAG TPA: HTH domain-containing protein [bacterium]|nr:HTH domain-containing protein [bacterium]
MEEISQITTIELYGQGCVSLKDVCDRFKIHRTTVWRQLKILRETGREGLVHKLKGRPSNRSKPEELRRNVCRLFEAENGSERTTVLKFFETAVRANRFDVSYATVRRWLKAAGKID